MKGSLMVLGTMSNAGKSLLAAGLCRAFANEGYSVAPFKAQNMALNSYITEEGQEIGRAQAMQAEACGIEPCWTMNPILLKPTGNMVSQVIARGKPVGNMSASEYYARKKDFVPLIKQAYETLASKYDIVVLEGAGSPAEINLKEQDIVNMAMAKLSHSPAILVGDIDRGGVFAQLLGTLMLLDNDEKDIVKALVINKFRGDKKLLESGLEMLYKMCNKPVAGVMPYVDCYIDDEDSLSERLYSKGNGGKADIVVIRLPRISNFTDFSVFEYMEDISLRYVSSVREMGNPDMVIIPGTKNTIGDLLWLRETGLEDKIKSLCKKGRLIFGICGGYQMLGEEIEDPYGTEYGGRVRAMGLLPVKTVFSKEKTTKKVKGNFGTLKGCWQELSKKSFSGYEIHMGVTELLKNTESLTEIHYNNEENTFSDGAYKENVCGTYVHGIFDNIASDLANMLFSLKGVDKKAEYFDLKAFKEKQYNILAEEIRKNVNMDMIYSIINKGI